MVQLRASIQRLIEANFSVKPDAVRPGVAGVLWLNRKEGVVLLAQDGAQAGRSAEHLHLLDVPSRTVPASLVRELLDCLEDLEKACTGKEPFDGDAVVERLTSYWDPEQWFDVNKEEIATLANAQWKPADIVDHLGVGDESAGVDRAEAVAWMTANQDAIADEMGDP